MYIKFQKIGAKLRRSQNVGKTGYELQGKSKAI